MQVIEWSLFALSTVGLGLIIVGKGRFLSTWFLVAFLAASTIGWKFFLKPEGTVSTEDRMVIAVVMTCVTALLAAAALVGRGGRLLRSHRQSSAEPRV